MSYWRALLSCLTLLFLYSSCVSAQYSIGDSCTLTSNNNKGQCVLLKNCPQALNNLKRRIHPQLCMYQGIEPIVCCEVQRKLPGDISKQKCVEYGKYVYDPTGKNTCAAGKINEQLIIGFGGEDASPREFPHMALLGYGEENAIQWACGGTLISEQYVLTAAHCLHHRNFGRLRFIRLGELYINTNSDKDQSEDFSVVDVIKHPQYEPPSKYNDIALVKLNRRVTFNPYIRPACLHTTATINETRFIATGWGITEFTGDKGSDVMQRVIVAFFSHDKCYASYESNISERQLKHGIVAEIQLCAGGMRRVRDTCQGDSGGPLQIYNNEVFCMYSVIGVTSFGKQCGVIGIPGVYTRVSPYVDWIEKIVWPEE